MLECECFIVMSLAFAHHVHAQELTRGKGTPLKAEWDLCKGCLCFVGSEDDVRARLLEAVSRVQRQMEDNESRTDSVRIVNSRQSPERGP